MDKLTIFTLLLSLFLQSCSNLSMKGNENQGEKKESCEKKDIRGLKKEKEELKIKFQKQIMQIEQLMAQIDELERKKSNNEEAGCQKVADQIIKLTQKTEELRGEYQEGMNKMNGLSIEALNILMARLLEEDKVSNKTNNNQAGNTNEAPSQNKSIAEESTTLNNNTYQTIVKKISQIKSPLKAGKDKVKFSLTGISVEDIKIFFQGLSINPEYITEMSSKVWIGLRTADYKMLQSKIKELANTQ